MQRVISFAALVCILWAGSAFAKVNSSVDGIVQDPLTFEMPGTYRFDANLSKTFRITETKALQIRLDAANVLNHPNPLPAAGATISINSTSGGDFGYLTNAKTGTRSFQEQLRLTF